MLAPKPLISYDFCEVKALHQYIPSEMDLEFLPDTVTCPTIGTLLVVAVFLAIDLEVAADFYFWRS